MIHRKPQPLTDMFCVEVGFVSCKERLRLNERNVGRGGTASCHSSALAHAAAPPHRRRRRFLPPTCRRHKQYHLPGLHDAGSSSQAHAPDDDLRTKARAPRQGGLKRRTNGDQRWWVNLTCLRQAQRCQRLGQRSARAEAARCAASTCAALCTLDTPHPAPAPTPAPAGGCPTTLQLGEFTQRQLGPDVFDLGAGQVRPANAQLHALRMLPLPPQRQQRWPHAAAVCASFLCERFLCEPPPLFRQPGPSSLPMDKIAAAAAHRFGSPGANPLVLQ